MIGYLFILLIVLLVAYGMLKQYNAQAVLMSAGLFLLAYAQIASISNVLPEAESRGALIFDLWHLFTKTSIKSFSGVGFTIISIAAVSSYMNAIGASKELVLSTSKFISKIRNPYILVLASMWLVFFIYMFVTSASALSLLLMGTLYPILRSAGISPKTIVATIVIPTAWEWGPGQTDVNLAAEHSGYVDSTVINFIIKHQTPLTLVILLLIPIVHVLWQTYMDKKDGYNVQEEKQKYLQELSSEEKEKDAVPSYYKYLPFLPLVFLIGFSSYFTEAYKMTVPVAMMLTTTIIIILESIRFLSVKKAFDNFLAWIDGSGKVFGSVITLLFAAQFFAEGLINMGAISAMINFAESVSLSGSAIAISFSIFVMIISFITGSGNAPFMAFVTLVPEIASKFGINPVLLALPLIFAAGSGRAISPVAGVVIIVAGMTKLSTLDVVKRTSVPILFTMLITFIWVVLRY